MSSFTPKSQCGDGSDSMSLSGSTVPCGLSPTVTVNVALPDTPSLSVIVIVGLYAVGQDAEVEVPAPAGTVIGGYFGTSGSANAQLGVERLGVAAARIGDAERHIEAASPLAAVEFSAEAFGCDVLHDPHVDGRGIRLAGCTSVTFSFDGVGAVVFECVVGELFGALGPVAEVPLPCRDIAVRVAARVDDATFWPSFGATGKREIAEIGGFASAALTELQGLSDRYRR